MALMDEVSIVSDILVLFWEIGFSELVAGMDSDFWRRESRRVPVEFSVLFIFFTLLCGGMLKRTCQRGCKREL